MPATLTVSLCSVTTNQIQITFSEAVDPTTATNPANYTVYDPPDVIDSNTGLPITLSNAGWSAGPLTSSDTVTFNAGPSYVFSAGDFVLIGISGVLAANGDTLAETPTNVPTQVPGMKPIGGMTRDVEDAVAYPLLTEEIGYRPSPVGLPTGGGGTGGGGGRSSLGQLAQQAVTDVLGWKANNADPKGFIGALTQAFTLTEVEGHVESTWMPRTYAVQTDLGGGITGAQASLYTRAKDALDQSLKLLDGLYPLDPDADPEYVKALREMARSQMSEIVKEFGAVGLPSILRIDTYFSILLGQNPAQVASGTGTVQFDPDSITGTLGTLRDVYGIFFVNNPFNNSVEDEQDITNFRVISDYMTSLMQSWIENRQFFILLPTEPAFFGTQLVLISRQLNVIAETVDEVRFALDSVFIGPSERQTLLLVFSDPLLPPMFLEDILDEVNQFVTDEGPRLLRDGGKISIANNIFPVVQALLHMMEQAHTPTNIVELPDGFQTARVQNSLDDLCDQLVFLINLTGQVEEPMPVPLEKLVLSGVTVSEPTPGTYILSLLGDNIQFSGGVTIHSVVPLSIPPQDVTFYSAQRIDVKVNPQSLRLERGNHHVTVKNPNGDSCTLFNALLYDDLKGSLTRGANPTVQIQTRGPRQAKRALPQRKAARANARTAKYQRRVQPSASNARTTQTAGSVLPATPTATGQSVTGLLTHVNQTKKELETKLADGLGKLSDELKDASTCLENRQNTLKVEIETKLAEGLEKLSDEFKVVSVYLQNQHNSFKADIEAKFTGIKDMLAQISAANSKVAEDSKKSKPKK